MEKVWTCVYILDNLLEFSRKLHLLNLKENLGKHVFLDQFLRELSGIKLS